MKSMGTNWENLAIQTGTEIVNTGPNNFHNNYKVNNY